MTGASRPGLFVVHKHAATHLHYDLRLELGGVLVSFAVPKGPSADPNEKRFAAHVENHPIEYADFEGVIPADNYGAGPSIVWDRGSWVNLPDPKHGLEHGKLLFDLHGLKLRGRWTLVRTKKDPSGKEWLLIKKPDAFASTGPNSWPEESIYSGVDVHDLPRIGELRERMRQELTGARLPRRDLDPRSIELMLADRAPEPFSRPGWIFELKYDGFRVLAGRQEGRPFMRFRGGSDATGAFPELARALAGLRHDCVIDTELVVLGPNGQPSFNRLQQRVQLKRAIDIDHATVSLPGTLFAFDLLSLEGHDLRDLPLLERKCWLRRVLPPIGLVRFADHIEEQGAALYEEVRKLNLEGVMAKRADAPYRGGRRREWLKVRGDRTGDFAVVGYTAPTGSRTGFGALDLAVWDAKGQQFVYAGSVGTGFSEAMLRSLQTRLEPTKRPTPPFVGTPMPGRKHTWVEPTLVVEVAFMEWSEAAHLRQPRFVRVRDDKAPKDCAAPADTGGTNTERAEPFDAHADSRPSNEPSGESKVAPAERRVVLSNEDKLFWPEDGYTKGDLIRYYREIAPWLLPYLRDRPVVLTRYPDGIHGKSFFQKDAPAFVPPWLTRVRIWSEQTSREVDHFVCNDEESLVYLANLGTIPLHVWSSRTQALQAPDWSIIDLDPKGAPFEHVVQVARKVHEICEDIGLPSFVKTSGSSGLHVLLPLGAQCTYDQSRGLAELISRVVVATLPEIATIERVIEARGGRVYLDYLQNGHGKLLAAPFSARPLPTAPVSMPLAWSEVNVKNHPRAFTIANAVKRMKKRKSDPLADVLGASPDLLAVLSRLSEHRALRPVRT